MATRFAGGHDGAIGFDADRRLAAITAKGDPLEMIARAVPFESFRPLRHQGIHGDEVTFPGARPEHKV